jgi:hypothetical protein
MDCDSKPKSHYKSNGNDKSNDYQLVGASTIKPNSNSNPTTTTTATSPGPAPAIARRRFRSPMRRDNDDPPSIFERDEAPTTGASGKPITVGDVFDYYLNHPKAAAQKRAPRPRTTRNFN